MEQKRDGFARAFATLRQRLRDETHRPGEQLKVAEVAESLKMTVTLVQEAISWLAGKDLYQVSLTFTLAAHWRSPMDMIRLQRR